MAHRGDERAQHRLLLGQQIAQMHDLLAQTEAARRNLNISRKRAAAPLHDHIRFGTWMQAAVIAVLTEDISIAIDLSILSKLGKNSKAFLTVTTRKLLRAQTILTASCILKQANLLQSDCYINGW